MSRSIRLDIDLPTPEAADLTTKAAATGLTTPEFLGYHVLRSAYGALHPRVVEIETRAIQGIVGTDCPKE